MGINYQDKLIIIKYLFKELDGIEKNNFEEKYFEDQELFEELICVEDELIDDYVRGTLPVETKEKFEKYFLTTIKRKQRVEFARALMEKCSKTVELKENWWTKYFNLFSKNPFIFRWAFISTGLMLCVIGLWFYIKKVDTLSKEIVKKQIPVMVKLNQGKTSEERNINIEPKPQTNDTVPKKPKSKEDLFSSDNTELQIAKFFPTTRNVGEVLNLPAKQQLINITLVVDGKLDYKKYFVELIEIETEKQLFQKVINISTNKKGEKLIALQISTKLLKTTNYEFNIFSFPDKNEYEQNYTFSVRKSNDP